MSQKSKGAMNLEASGYPAADYQALKRFLARLLTVTHRNQVESILAYANSVNGNSAVSEAANRLSSLMGVTTDRIIPRMSGNNFPRGDAPDAEFAGRLASAKRDILGHFGQQDLMADLDCNYRVVGKAVYRGHTRVALCLSPTFAIDIAAALAKADKKKV